MILHRNKAKMLGAPSNAPGGGRGGFEDAYQRAAYRDGTSKRVVSNHKAMARRTLRRQEKIDLLRDLAEQLEAIE